MGSGTARSRATSFFRSRDLWDCSHAVVEYFYNLFSFAIRLFRLMNNNLINKVSYKVRRKFGYIFVLA